MIQGVLFDFDGVICQTETCKLDAMAVYLKSLGLSVEPKALYRMAGGTFLEKESQMDSIFGDQKKYWEVKEQAMSFRMPPVSFFSILTEGVTEVLRCLREEKIKIAVASNSKADRLRPALEECGLLPCCDAVFSAFDLGRRKPDPYVYVYAMEQLKLKPAECLIVEDSSLGIQAGKAAGAKVIALRDRDGMIDQSEADIVISRMEEVLVHIR